MARNLSLLLFAMCTKASWAYMECAVDHTECDVDQARVLLEQYTKESKAQVGGYDACDAFATYFLGSTNGFPAVGCLINGCTGPKKVVADKITAEQTKIHEELCKGICANKDSVHFCYGFTTTMTPWDSSASSSGDSNSLESSFSASFEEDRSGDSMLSHEWTPSGSQASGSSGFYPYIWQWSSMVITGVSVLIFFWCCYGVICCTGHYSRRQRAKQAMLEEEEGEEILGAAPCLCADVLCFWRKCMKEEVREIEEEDEETELTAAQPAPVDDDMPLLQPYQGVSPNYPMTTYPSTVV